MTGLSISANVAVISTVIPPVQDCRNIVICFVEEQEAIFASSHEVVVPQQAYDSTVMIIISLNSKQ